MGQCRQLGRPTQPPQTAPSARLQHGVTARPQSAHSKARIEGRLRPMPQGPVSEHSAAPRHWQRQNCAAAGCTRREQPWPPGQGGTPRRHPEHTAKTPKRARKRTRPAAPPRAPQQPRKGGRAVRGPHCGGARAGPGGTRSRRGGPLRHGAARKGAQTQLTGRRGVSRSAEVGNSAAPQTACARGAQPGNQARPTRRHRQTNKHAHASKQAGAINATGKPTTAVRRLQPRSPHAPPPRRPPP
jgi:hypothetical protein